jgi:hypothetical protein
MRHPALRAWIARISALGLALLAASCVTLTRPARIADEASANGRSATSFPTADEDYFHGMDGRLALTPAEIKGRNTWLLWTAGNDRFWDKVTDYTFGTFDLLKTLSSYPGLKASRDNRWNYLGLVNEPCFEKATGPNPRRFGLWLDVRSTVCPPDPFENEGKYPGVAIGARGKNGFPVGSAYGYATGVIGLRLFPNPDFDSEAARRWDPVRYYTDPSYYNSKDLRRPYRVGMSCAFCHVSPNPDNPPADPEHPRWENLSSLVGAQYFWVDRIFSWSADPSAYLFQVLHTSRPGSLDTSLVATDYINNPRTMNAIYSVGPRLQAALRWGKETLAGGALNNRQFNDYFASGPFTRFFQPPSTVWTPHVLKDGSDSVGTLGALNRVFVNIGLFSEEWVRHFRPVLGGAPQTPITLADLRANSAYWNATEAQTPDMALFLIRASYPHKLREAPDGAAYLDADAATLRRGKIAFGENCARCHSSKAPEPPPGANPGACIGPGYLTCWSRYWNWSETEDFKRKMRPIVLADDFLDGNYLSNDMRIPVTLLQTNACSPLATNSIRDRVWDNFSSESYKQLPSVGSITVYDPFTGRPRQFPMPGGGVGYTRVPTLISLWSTAPFLLNNSVGTFNPSPSVAARMASFNDAISQMLWPQQRRTDPVLGRMVPGVIDRTTASSYLRIPAGYLPDFVRKSEAIARLVVPSLFDGQGGLQIGPIPKGTPVDLLANLRLVAETDDPAQRAGHDARILGLLIRAASDLKALPAGATDEQARQVFANLAQPLFELSKCPDYVMNRGHYFGAQLSDADKRALIAFLKTF